MKVFIDTSAFVALLVENEETHVKVSKKYQTYRQQRVVFFTSYYILDELFTRLLYYKTADIKKCIGILQKSVAANELTILNVNEKDFEKSISLFLKFSDQNLSFTDVTTYFLYKEFKIDEIFTLDSDFKKVRLNTSF
jgi:uncharacterized protein